jgi:hypothetical protein
LYVNGTLSEIVFDGNVAGSRSLSTATDCRTCLKYQSVASLDWSPFVNYRKHQYEPWRRIGLFFI